MDELNVIQPTPEETNTKNQAEEPKRYSLTIEDAAEYLLSAGYRTAPRTIAWHCQTNLLDCRKFTSGNTLKWKITRASLDERIETLKREGTAIAGNGEQLPASNVASNSAQVPAGASELSVEIMQVLRSELDEKNKQIAEFQHIVREHNKQFENLNRTIQLSNETIQQLNRTLALPQVREVMESTNRSWERSDGVGPNTRTYSHSAREDDSGGDVVEPGDTGG